LEKLLHPSSAFASRYNKGGFWRDFRSQIELIKGRERFGLVAAF
jgi:hypothetical protein